MAGHVTKRHLKLPEVDKLLLEGCVLWKWEDGDSTLQKLTFKADKDGFFLHARGEDDNKVYESYIWDLQLVSDVRGGKTPKDARLLESMLSLTGSESLDGFSLMLVYRRDGIVNLDTINLICEWPDTAEHFKRAVNSLTYCMLHAHAAPVIFYRKNYVKILLHANGYGRIQLKYLNRLMMNRHTAASYVNQFLSGFNIVVTPEEKGGEKHVHVNSFTWDIFIRMVDQLLNNRTEDLDLIIPSVSAKKVTIQKVKIELSDFQKFLNTEQRDPRLNEILHPPVSKAQAKEVMEKNGGKDRMTARGLLDYLMSEDNNVLDLSSLDQFMDMNKPLNHYFINSSHNTYLNGHQLRSQSLSEMYIQTLLKGCRCLELDCWPTGAGESEDIMITHGGTLCTKVTFKECVEAISEFAFATSDYPVILSIENHCKSRPTLIQKMANIFTTTFGDKLMKEPFDDLPLEPGKPLPPIERLKGKILLKDKVKRKKEATENATLPRNTHGLTSIMEDTTDPQANGDKQADCGSGKENGSASNGEKAEGKEGEKAEGKEGEKAEGKEEEKAEGKEGESSAESVKDGEGEGVKETGGEVKSDGEGKGEKDGEGGKDKGEEDGKKDEVEKEPEAEGTDPDSQQVKKRKQSAVSEDSAQLVIATPVTPMGKSPMNTLKRGEQLPGMEDMPVRWHETEAMVSGPLKELLNYTTGITFEGFAAADKLNCGFYMSSFVEDKGQNFIKTQARDFVKYNQRQNSRIYPNGTRINSSNYMPQIFWNVGCQFVALNYQTPDLPVQLNMAKFEFNGGTGFIQKPWVMMRDGGGAGIFNPFTQSKLENIVPARVSIKIISGSFLTEKRTNCLVEAEMYGLPADTVRRQYTKKAAAPHPFWNEKPFTFKRILLPELAILRVAVFDDDRELIGQRCLPVNHIRPGFRYIPLRDKHNHPLPLAMLFVNIKVEDWVPNEFEDVVAMLMDPVSFATKALEELAKGDDFDDIPEGGESEAVGLDVSSPAVPKTPLSSGAAGGFSPIAHPTSAPYSAARAGAPHSATRSPLGPATDSSLSSGAYNLRHGSVPQTATMSDFPDTLPCFEKAKERSTLEAVKFDSKSVTEQSEYSKLIRRVGKQRQGLVKGQEKSYKSAQSKLQKSKSLDLKSPKDLEGIKTQQKQEITSFDRDVLLERHKVHRKCLEAAHRMQMEELIKIQKSDLESMPKELAALSKKHSKSAQISDKKLRAAAGRDMEEKAIKLGKSLTGEFSKLHGGERTRLEESQGAEMKRFLESQEKEKNRLESIAEKDEASPSSVL